MFPPFPETDALIFSRKIIDSIHADKILLQNKARLSDERLNQDVMLGVAVCTFGENQIVLAAISGVSKEMVVVENSISDNFKIVEPIVNPLEIEKALNQNDKEIHLLTDKINQLKAQKMNPLEVANLTEKRNSLCNESLQKVYDLYSFHCIDGKIRSLKEICLEYNNEKNPPTGTGECAEIKILDYAFKNAFTVKSLCEVKVSTSYDKNSDCYKLISTDFTKSEPCDSRCSILLSSMLGLRILYRDDDIIVVNKQSGLLSVPGRTPDKQDCVVNRLKLLFPNCLEQPAVHRLDMETSGLLILAFTKEAHKNINRQFEDKTVYKEYEAILDGNLKKKGVSDTGKMELFFRVDIENRPHQIYDEVYGKNAITEWKILNVENYTNPLGQKKVCTRVRFIPHTGRTHQLRTASSDVHGFSTPIVGDTLYGTCLPGERLLLHSTFIRFVHPTTNQIMEFSSPAEF